MAAKRQPVAENKVKTSHNNYGEDPKMAPVCTGRGNINSGPEGVDDRATTTVQSIATDILEPRCLTSEEETEILSALLTMEADQYLIAINIVKSGGCTDDLVELLTGKQLSATLPIELQKKLLKHVRFATGKYLSYRGKRSGKGVKERAVRRKSMEEKAPGRKTSRNVAM